MTSSPGRNETRSAAEQHDSVPGSPTITVDIWSDVVCPWCYIGKRRFERALDELDDEMSVHVTYRAYQLDPTASPGRSAPVLEAYAKKFGGPEAAKQIITNVTAVARQEGLEFRMDRALRANTLLAHRLLWAAGQPGSPNAQAVIKERLLAAYFTDGLDIGDPDTLTDLAVEVGFDRADIRAFFDSDQGSREVAAEMSLAAQQGITAVPTFVINGQWAIPGAQDADTFVQVFRKLAAKQAMAQE